MPVRASRIARSAGAIVAVATALALCPSLAVGQTASTPPPDETDDGWPDASDFLDEKYGFLPLVIPITEPAVGYGAGVGAAFISAPLGAARSGYDRPDITVVGGMYTDNGSWGAVAGDWRHWMDDRLQTLAGVVYSSVNLDFYGIGEDSVLKDDPLRYTLEPKGGAVQGKYRLGDSRAWIGLSYAFFTTRVTFEAPAGTPSLPDYDEDSNVGGLIASLTFDSRDNVFTPIRGTYVEGLVGLFDEALGGDDEFQRARIIGMQFFPTDHRIYFGYRGEVAAVSSAAPFYLKPFVSMRGAPIMRYQGEEIAQLEAELRWQFWKRLSVVGFGGYGVTWNDFERLDDTRTVTTGGAGIRYELARRYGIHVGLDVAVGPDDNTAIYVQFGSAWARP